MNAGEEKMRKPRSDSLRNRVRLLETAKAAFTELGADVALEEIARRAGVGIGTLYRNFPTREALLAAVYQREVEQLGAWADTLLETRRAGEALEAWLHLLVDYMSTKRVIMPAIQASAGEGSQVYAATGAMITDAMAKLTFAAISAGDIRPDVEPGDVYRAMVGVAFGYDQPGWEASACRLIDVLMAGLRSRT